MDTDYYKVLGVERSAGDAEIKAAYKKLALKWHPDRNGGSKESSRKFKEIVEAYEVLGDRHKRALYDELGMDRLEDDEPTPRQSAGTGFKFGFDGGSTFTSRSSAASGSLKFSPVNPNKIFEQFLGGGGSTSGFTSSTRSDSGGFTSTDRGKAFEFWKNVSDGLSSGDPGEVFKEDLSSGFPNKKFTYWKNIYDGVSGSSKRPAPAKSWEEQFWSASGYNGFSSMGPAR
ncbi:DnaJ domain-containing protein [Mycena vulgaris]|nr:DnaJ domain-containing protein [Mycena vulgaris]